MRTHTSFSWCLVLLFGLTVAESPGQTPSAVANVPSTWQRWEHVLTSTRHYGNPYADVTLRVCYTGPGGQTLRTYGFWDGSDTFRIRCAFPTPGTWQWETECSDAANAGLHQQHGTMDISAYRGDNPLYRRGFLRVSQNQRYLAYADNTPFLWIGDTAWAGPRRQEQAMENGKPISPTEPTRDSV